MREILVQVTEPENAYSPTSHARVLFPPKKRKEKQNGHMIKCLLTERGRAGQENIWLEIRTHGNRCARSVCLDLEPDIFPSGPPIQLIITCYIIIIMPTRFQSVLIVLLTSRLPGLWHLILKSIP